MERSIRVRILGRDYPLRVRQEEDEAATREMAGSVDARMQAFKRQHPDQPDLVAAVVTALSFAEELATLREATDADTTALDGVLAALDRRLAEALADAPPANGQPAADAG